MPSTTASKSKLTHSLRMQERGKKLIPGLSQLISKRPDRFAPGIWPGYFKTARGVMVTDLDDNTYIDMSIGGIGATVLGYQDPDVDAAVTTAISNGVASSLNCVEDVELAELLCEIHPWADKVRFARSGGEATTIAVRIARTTTGRDKIAFCGYHGWHDWYLAANLGTADALGNFMMSGLEPNGVPRGLEGTALPFHYNKLDELTTIVANHGADLAAIIMEPIRSAKPDPGFFDEVTRLAGACGALLIIDEISAGFRLNSGGAHLILNITPDIAVFAKAIGNGYPMAAIIGKGAVMDAAQNSFISSTNWTERIGPTAALATIKKHRRLDAGKHLTALGNAVQTGWRQLAEKHGLDIHVDGIPPMSHFGFNHKDNLSLRSLFVQLMLHRGFLATTMFYAMYPHTDVHVNSYLQAVDEAYGVIAEAIASGDIAPYLEGEPATAGFARLA